MTNKIVIVHANKAMHEDLIELLKFYDPADQYHLIARTPWDEVEHDVDVVLLYYNEGAMRNSARYLQSQIKKYGRENKSVHFILVNITLPSQQTNTPFPALCAKNSVTYHLFHTNSNSDFSQHEVTLQNSFEFRVEFDEYLEQTYEFVWDGFEYPLKNSQNFSDQFGNNTLQDDTEELWGGENMQDDTEELWGGVKIRKIPISSGRKSKKHVN